MKLRFGSEYGLSCFWIEGNRDMLMNNLPSILTSLTASSNPQPHLRRGVIWIDACEVRHPVGDRQVAADVDAQILHLCPGGCRHAGQTGFPQVAASLYASDLERRFHIEDHNIWGVVDHNLIEIFGADGTGLIGNQLANLGLVLSWGGYGGHRRKSLSIGFQGVARKCLTWVNHLTKRVRSLAHS